MIYIVCCAIAYTFFLTMLRIMSPHISPMYASFVISCAGMVLAFPLVMWVEDVHFTSRGLLYALLAGAAVMVMDYCLYNAFKTYNPAAVTPLVYTLTILGVTGLMLFGTIDITAKQVLGIVLALASVFLLA